MEVLMGGYVNLLFRLDFGVPTQENVGETIVNFGNVLLYLVQCEVLQVHQAFFLCVTEIRFMFREELRNCRIFLF